MTMVEVSVDVLLDRVLDEAKPEDVIDYYGGDALVEAIRDKCGDDLVLDEFSLPDLLRAAANKLEEYLKRQSKNASSTSV